MRTLRGRLILSHLLPVLVILPLIALLLYLLFTTQNTLSGMEAALDAEAAHLADRTELLAEVVGRLESIWLNPEEAQEFVSNINLEVQTVMLLDAEGRVLSSTDPADTEQIGEIFDNENVAAIIGGKSRIEIRYDDLFGRQIAEVILPVFDADRQLSGVIRMNQSLAEVQQRFDRVYRILLSLVVILLVAGLLLGLYLALRLERSLRRVTTALQEIAGGEAPRSLPDQEIVEIDQLYRAVNALVERLQTLEAARKRLLANLVHELGRPLGSLRAAIHALRHGAEEDAELRDDLLAGMDRQIGLMEPLLADLTRLHSQVLGPLELSRTPVVLSQWLPKLMTLWREAAQQKGITWRADIPLNLPTVEVDPEQLGRAFGNLFSNAVKYTPPDGAITVEAGADAERWWLKVTDNGPGIPADELDQIFEPFQRGQGDRRFPQGMGLGLSIAHDVIIAHGGRIDVSSSPGDGAQFTAIFPLVTIPGDDVPM